MKKIVLSTLVISFYLISACSTPDSLSEASPDSSAIEDEEEIRLDSEKNPGDLEEEELDIVLDIELDIEPPPPPPVVKKVEFTGSFEGILPCSDCEGIRTRLKLETGKRFLYVQERMDEDIDQVILMGLFEQTDDPNVILIRDKQKKAFRYFEIDPQNDRVYYLGEDVKRITGKRSDQYTLKKAEQ